MSLLLPIAIAYSSVMILMLWHADPKRLRTAGRALGGDGTAKRRILAVATLLPGVLIASLGDSAAFLVWFGTCALVGWLIAHLPS